MIIKNKKGNILLSLLFFIMALGVLIVFISPINAMINMMQESGNLNCKGYLDDGKNETYSSLAFNSTKNGEQSGSPLSCMTLKLYLPYILLIFLIAGISAVMGGKGADWFGLESQSQEALPY